MLTLDNVSRIEIISNNLGREFVISDVVSCCPSLQDDGRTLKLFIERGKKWESK